MVVRVKSGHFGHQVNSDIRLLTVEIQMKTALNEPSHQDFLLFAYIGYFFIPVIKI